MGTDRARFELLTGCAIQASQPEISVQSRGIRLPFHDTTKPKSEAVTTFFSFFSTAHLNATPSSTDMECCLSIHVRPWNSQASQRDVKCDY